MNRIALSPSSDCVLSCVTLRFPPPHTLLSCKKRRSVRRWKERLYSVCCLSALLPSPVLLLLPCLLLERSRSRSVFEIPLDSSRKLKASHAPCSGRNPWTCSIACFILQRFLFQNWNCLSKLGFLYIKLDSMIFQIAIISSLIWQMAMVHIWPTDLCSDDLTTWSLVSCNKIRRTTFDRFISTFYRVPLRVKIELEQLAVTYASNSWVCLYHC